MGKSLRRQIKREKVIEGFESAGYEIVEWYIDPAKNCCVYISVKNLANNIEFLCVVPNNFHLSTSEGVFVYEDPINSPDVDDAISLWNECPLTKIFFKIHDKVVLKNGKHDYTVYTCKYEQPDEEDINELERYANEMNILNEEMLKDDSSEKTSRVIIDKMNPFDILIDGGSFQKTSSKRIDDVQPCSLVEYDGYTLGQAMPVIDFLEFFNKEDLGENINLLAKNVKTIYTFQNTHIKNLFDEAITSLENFTEQVKANYEEYMSNIEKSEKDFDTIQRVLEKNNGTSRTNDISARAQATLRSLLASEIEKRDSIIMFLDQIRKTFGEL